MMKIHVFLAPCLIKQNIDMYKDKNSLFFFRRGPFTCTEKQCGLVFSYCCDYSLHYHNEHSKRRKAALRCQICEKRLNRDSTGDEIRSGNNSTFPCQSCGQTFYSSIDYDNHNRIVHAKLKPYKCTLCPKRFTQPGGLSQHMRVHAGIRPFSCTYCIKTFTQKAGLQQHLRTHTKVKPFTCIVCQKQFSQSVHLRQHMRVHTNIQPFECTVCQRRFKQSSHLNFHMRTHPDVSSYANNDVTPTQENVNDLLSQQYLIESTPIKELRLMPQKKPESNLQHQEGILKLNDLLPMQGGDALYYTAKITPDFSQTGLGQYNLQILADKVLTL